MSKDFHVISHHVSTKPSMLNKLLPSIKRDIVAPVHVGCIKEFIKKLVLDNPGPLGVTSSPGLSIASTGTTNPINTPIRTKFSFRSN